MVVSHYLAWLSFIGSCKQQVGDATHRALNTPTFESKDTTLASTIIPARERSSGKIEHAAAAHAIASAIAMR